MLKKQPRGKREERGKFTLSLPMEMLIALKVRAARERRTVSRFVEEWIRSWMPKKD